MTQTTSKIHKPGFWLSIILAVNSGPTWCRPVPQPLRNYVGIAEDVVILENATLFVGDGQPGQPDQTVVIKGDSIAWVGPSGKMPLADPAALRMDLAGHTIIPGIVGIHNHTHMPGIPFFESSTKLNLAHGVTTIQTAGSADAIMELRWSQRIAQDQAPGPHIVPSAPYITGPGGNGPMEKPVSADQAQAFVETWSRRGVQWFKLYRHTTPDIARVVIEAAHQNNSHVTGHLCSITYSEAASMGIDRIEHGLNAATDFVADKQSGKCVPSRSSKRGRTADDPEIAELIQTLVDNRVVVTSTLAILESGFSHRPQGDATSLSFLTPRWREAYTERQKQLASTSNPTQHAYWQLLLDFERAFVDAGGILVAGPDTGRHVLPGLGDQRNFELLREARFSTGETVQIMTSNGAQALGLKDRGRLEPGLQADLVVLVGDLTQAPTVIRNVRWVFRKGFGYRPEALLDGLEGTVGPP